VNKCSLSLLFFTLSTLAIYHTIQAPQTDESKSRDGRKKCQTRKLQAEIGTLHKRLTKTDRLCNRLLYYNPQLREEIKILKDNAREQDETTIMLNAAESIYEEACNKLHHAEKLHHEISEIGGELESTAKQFVKSEEQWKKQLRDLQTKLDDATRNNQTMIK